jgi:hypothetical protein
MAGVIVLSDQAAASDADLLSGTRLQTVPAGGFLTFELQATSSSATDNFTVSIQMPNGDTPLNNVRVPAGVTFGGINNNDKMMITLPIQQGGHTVFSCVESGACTLSYRVTYSPA